jgi:hypothetical protein
VAVVFVVGVLVVAELTFVALGVFASFLQLVIVAKEITLTRMGRIIFFITVKFSFKVYKIFFNLPPLHTLNFIAFFCGNYFLFIQTG